MAIVQMLSLWKCVYPKNKNNAGSTRTQCKVQIVSNIDLMIYFQEIGLRIPCH